MYWYQCNPYNILFPKRDCLTRKNRKTSSEIQFRAAEATEKKERRIRETAASSAATGEVGTSPGGIQLRKGSGVQAGA